ncbi:uncharacterized protein RCO7_10658 [Rhynchosporium graminicola]|uniref:NAD(P)-binding domain-containing protein n=1 Tax=Rhynchosporium graminicola TaxID=2792576 RepID=A0A1E1L178_9HELO|nr:uncharacterized protein RCO7_10658 [Rhynchosporium commune]
MRVLLLGPTGNLGLRMIPALIAHGHQLTVFVRNPSKLHSLVSTELLALIHAIAVGDATDIAALKKAIIDNDIESIICVAGNQVLPWKDYSLPKIAKAISGAALAVGKERGTPMRIWVTSGILIMKIPGEEFTMMDYLPRIATAQHEATRANTEMIPTADLQWSIFAASGMTGRNPSQGLFQPLEAPQPHDLLARATVLPVWRRSWPQKIPFIGMIIHMVILAYVDYHTEYEDVADFLAEDLEVGDGKWVGKKVVLVKMVIKKDV